jgi:crotonobetainyl-CoA:carnitine CoA-transferase CaiB-like acyl-CoA transferase
VGVQGRQLTLDEPTGGGILFTPTPPGKTPTAAAFQDEVKAYLGKQKVKVSPIPAPRRIFEKPQVDAFGFDAELEAGKARLEYAVMNTPDGGVTVAARFPEKVAAELKPDFDRILKGLSVTKRIAEK